jgi:hypothetical protein
VVCCQAKYGVNNIKNNIRRGKYGIELVLEYLKTPREHPSWQHDELLVIKLEHIYQCFEGQFLLSSLVQAGSSSLHSN